jgi:hypothetical protein
MYEMGIFIIKELWRLVMFGKKVVVFVFASLLILLSACTVQSNLGWKGSDIDSSDYTESRNSGDGSGTNWEKGASATSGTYLIEEQQMENSADGIKALEVINTAGNIKVLHSGSGQIDIKAVKKVRGLDEKSKKEIMEKIDIKVEKVGDKLKIHAVTSEDRTVNLWNWVEKLNKGLNVNIEYEIKVPDGIKAYNIDCNAGNTTFEAIQGEVRVKQNAGTVTFEKVILNGSSSIDMNAGNVIMDANIDNATAVTIKGNAGNVNVKLPEKTAFSLETRLAAGNISGDFLSGTRVVSGTLKQEFNGGGTKLTVNLAAGNVIINKK